MRNILIAVLLSFILTLPSIGVQGQSNCGITSSTWKEYENFIPRDDSPIFTVRVNFIIPQKSDGSANFRADDKEAIEMFEESIVGTNKLWSNLKRPNDPDCYSGSDHLNDSHIRFALNEIIFIQDDFYWNGENGSGCPNDRSWYLNSLNEEIIANPKYASAVNIYLPNISSVYEALVVDKTSTAEPSSPPPCSELPSHKKLGRSSRINLSGTYNKFHWMQHVYPLDTVINTAGHPWDPVVYGWMKSSFYHTLAHELGHTMGLSHSNEHHGRNKCDESIMP